MSRRASTLTLRCIPSRSQTTKANLVLPSSRTRQRACSSSCTCVAGNGRKPPTMLEPSSGVMLLVAAPALSDADPAFAAGAASAPGELGIDKHVMIHTNFASQPPQICAVARLRVETRTLRLPVRVGECMMNERYVWSVGSLQRESAASKEQCLCRLLQRLTWGKVFHPLSGSSCRNVPAKPACNLRRPTP